MNKTLLDFNSHHGKNVFTTFWGTVEYHIDEIYGGEKR